MSSASRASRRCRRRRTGWRSMRVLVFLAGILVIVLAVRRHRPAPAGVPMRRGGARDRRGRRARCRSRRARATSACPPPVEAPATATTAAPATTALPPDASRLHRRRPRTTPDYNADAARTPRRARCRRRGTCPPGRRWPTIVERGQAERRRLGRHVAVRLAQPVHRRRSRASTSTCSSTSPRRCSAARSRKPANTSSSR